MMEIPLGTNEAGEILASKFSGGFDRIIAPPASRIRM